MRPCERARTGARMLTQRKRKRAHTPSLTPSLLLTLSPPVRSTQEAVSALQHLQEENASLRAQLALGDSARPADVSAAPPPAPARCRPRGDSSTRRRSSHSLALTPARAFAGSARPRRGRSPSARTASKPKGSRRNDSLAGELRSTTPSCAGTNIRLASLGFWFDCDLQRVCCILVIGDFGCTCSQRGRNCRTERNWRDE